LPKKLYSNVRVIILNNKVLALDLRNFCKN
jgi:hypothetical protein